MNSEKKGIIFAILAPLFYSLRSLMIKISPSTSMETYILYTNLFSFFLLLPIFAKNRACLSLHRFPLHLLRSILSIPAILFSYYGIRHLALVDAILLENSMPIFILCFVILFRKKIVNKLAIFSIILGFSGLFFILKPQLDIWHLASFASLGSAIFGALICVILSDLSKANHFLSILFYSYLITLPCFALFYFINPEPIANELWVYLIVTSIFITCFRYVLIQSYRFLPPHIVGSWVYLGIFFSAVWDWVIWKTGLDLLQIVGGSIIILASLLALKTEKTLQVSSKTT